MDVNSFYLYNTLDVIRDELIGRDYHFFVDDYDNKIEVFFKHKDLGEPPHDKFIIKKTMFVGESKEVYSRILDIVLDYIVGCGLCNNISHEEFEKFINKLLTLEV